MVCWEDALHKVSPDGLMAEMRGKWEPTFLWCIMRPLHERNFTREARKRKLSSEKPHYPVFYPVCTLANKITFMITGLKPARTMRDAFLFYMICSSIWQGMGSIKGAWVEHTVNCVLQPLKNNVLQGFYSIWPINYHAFSRLLVTD